jgi:hypothetical protein
MYINLSVFGKSGLEYSDLVFLCGINQTQTDWLIENLKESDYKRFERLSLIKHIKQKSKKEHLYISLRLSDTGKKLINSIFTEPVAGEDEEILYEWLSKYYIDKGKEVGNPNRVKKLLAWFSQETDIYKNNLIKLFVDFLKDDYVDEASKVLEFTLFYPRKFTTDKGKTIAYEAKPDIYDSWLFKHFEKNKQRLLETFE